MRLTIDIAPNLDDALTAASTADAVSNEVWVQRKIEHLLIATTKDAIAQAVKTLKTADMVDIKAVLDPLFAAIKTRDKPPTDPIGVEALAAEDK